MRDESQSCKPTSTIIYNLEPVKSGVGDPDLVLRGDANTRKSVSVSSSPCVGIPDLVRGENMNVKEIKEVSSINTSTTISLILSVKINGITVEAIIDTGAHITVINEKLAKQLKIPEVRGDPMYLKGVPVDENTKIKARNGGEARIVMGKTEAKWQLIVAEITDHVIIGLDLLCHLHAIIDLTEYTIKIGSERLMANCIQAGDQRSKIRKVQLPKRIVIPHKTTVQFSAKLEEGSHEDICIQPTQQLKGLVMPHAVVKGDEKVPIVIKNLPDNFVCMKKNTIIGIGTEVEEVCCAETTELPSVRQTKLNDQISNEIPPYLQDLPERSKKHLNDEQINQLNQLLIKFQNTFPKDDMDIGHFTRIEHRIDTRDALPTKEGIRTPLGIEKEEEEHLKYLLKKGIIQPSSSE